MKRTGGQVSVSDGGSVSGSAYQTEGQRVGQHIRLMVSGQVSVTAGWLVGMLVYQMEVGGQVSVSDGGLV